MCVALDKIENRGFERGFEIGFRIGFEQGIKLVKIIKYEIAINFLKMGLHPEQVAQGVNLPLEKVRQLQLEHASD